MWDIFIVIIIAIIFLLLIVKKAIYDYKKAQFRKKCFFEKEERPLSRAFEIRAIYGSLIGLIMGCIVYIYLRVTGQLENIFPYFFSP